MKTHTGSTHQSRLTGGIERALAAIALLLATAAPALAGQGNVGNPGIAPPQSHFRGQSYAEWSAAYFEWVYSLPVDRHPLFDTAPCSEGQTGNVWFIDGTHGTPFPPAGRDCTIPAGTALFLSLAARNQENENGCDGDVIQRTDYDEAELRAMAHDGLNGFLGSRGIVIDGVQVLGLPACDPSNPSTCESPYRVQSPVFDYTVPLHNSILVGDYGPCYDSPPRTEPYTVQGVVADGVYVMIKPLPVGEHILQFGPLPAPGGSFSRLYRITVE